MVFVEAKEGPPNYGSKTYTVQYFDDKGNMIIRSGGTKAWRNNNPGNMKYLGGFAARHGAIGHAGFMAVFPSEAIGRQALILLLKSANYNTLKIGDLPEKYDKENAKNYRHMLLSISKLDPDKRIKDLTAQEFDRLRIAIERIEGWEKGKEDFIDRWFISAVHKKRGVIYEYLIQRKAESRWVSKTQALELACKYFLHATTVHLKNGTVFLRPEFGTQSFVEA